VLYKCLIIIIIITLWPLLYYESKIPPNLTFIHNIEKYRPIFKVLSPLHLAVNLQQNALPVLHCTLELLPHYHEKCETSKMQKFGCT